MKFLQQFCKVMAIMAFVFLLGTAGSVDMNTISVGRALLQIFMAILTMGTSLFFWRVIWVSEKRKGHVKKTSRPTLRLVYVAPEHEKVS